MLRQFEKINTIIWDCNGTLLNDTDICISTINELLAERGLSEISRENYLELFGFPVIDYYKKIGFKFEKESFEIPANQYIQKYHSKLSQCELHNQVLEVLKYFKESGFKQLVLSASEDTKLKEAITHFKIVDFFDEISGLDNHFAFSKTTLGINMLNKLKISPENTCLIGDTDHDSEVADAIGCKCILIADGHQSKSRLEETGSFVIDNLKDLFNVLR